MVREKTEYAFPLDAEEVEGGYDNEYLAEDFARYFRAFLTSGIIADGGNIAESLQVVANDDMTTTLKKGNLIIDGRRYELERDMVFQHRAADGVLDRIDRISITYGTAENDIYANMREGEYSYKPVAPPCRRSSEYMDYVVADVRIVNGAIKITQANITDTRLSTELCGIAFPFWKLDTGPFFAQLNSFYNEFVLKSDRSYEEFLAWAEKKKAEIIAWKGQEKDETDAWQEEFINDLESWAHGKMEVWTNEILEWFQNIRDQLTDDPAMNLQEQIGNLKNLNTTKKDNLINAVNEVKATSLPVINFDDLAGISCLGERAFTLWVNGKPANITDGFEILNYSMTVEGNFWNNQNDRGAGVYIRNTTGSPVTFYILFKSQIRDYIQYGRGNNSGSLPTYELTGANRISYINIASNSNPDWQMISYTVNNNETFYFSYGYSNGSSIKWIGAEIDILPVNKGGTGQTTEINAANALINALNTGTDVPSDNDYFISQYCNGGTKTTTYHRRQISKLWEYIKGKINATTDIKATKDGSGNVITDTYARKDAVLKLVETGEFTNDTVLLPLRYDASYMLVTREITISTGKVYGFRVRIYATPKSSAGTEPSVTNAAASTNAGVSFSTSSNSLSGGDAYGITLKATATYRVSYALYEFKNSYGDYSVPLGFKWGPGHWS